MASNQGAPVLIIGRNGTLGKAFARVCENRCLNYRLMNRQECDISNPLSIENAIQLNKPWAIINAAGFVKVDDAESEIEACMSVNTHGPLNLAMACNTHGIQLLTFSSDLVFDGKKNTPYTESDPTGPLNQYGVSKANSELLVQQAFPSALVIRTSAFFGPWDEHNFVHHIRKAMSQYEVVHPAYDHISPTYVPHLVHTALDLLVDREKGIWHLANEGSISWSDLAFDIAERFELDHSLIHPVSGSELNYPARRPSYSVLGTERGQLMPPLEQALNEYFHKKKTENRKVA